MKFDVSFNIQQQTRGNFVTYRNSTNNSGSDGDSDCDNEEDSDGNNDEGDGAKTRTHDEPGKLVNHEIKLKHRPAFCIRYTTI